MGKYNVAMMVFLPNSRLKPLPASVGNCDIREEVVVVVGYERVGQKEPERMFRGASKDIVAESAATTIGSKGRVVE
jgi:hypothetical protein